jgi:hypothetical protein
MPAQRLYLEKVMTSSCMQTWITDGRLCNDFLANTQNGEENDVHCCCICLIAANTWKNGRIAWEMSKGFHLGGVNRRQGPNVYANTYTSSYHKSEADDYHRSKQTLATAIESINANGQYDSMGILVCVLLTINSRLTANDDSLGQK